jgi:hypothetical protein
MKGKRTYLSDGVMEKYRPSLGVAQCPNVVVQHGIVLPLKTSIQYKLILINDFPTPQKKKRKKDGDKYHFESHNVLLDLGNCEVVVDELFEFLVMFQFAGGDVGRDVVHANQVRGAVPRGGVVVFRYDVGREDIAAAWGSYFFAFFDESPDLGVSQELSCYFKPKNTIRPPSRGWMDPPQGDDPQSEWADIGKSG